MEESWQLMNEWANIGLLFNGCCFILAVFKYQRISSYFLTIIILFLVNSCVLLIPSAFVYFLEQLQQLVSIRLHPHPALDWVAALLLYTVAIKLTDRIHELQHIGAQISADITIIFYYIQAVFAVFGLAIIFDLLPIHGLVMIQQIQIILQISINFGLFIYLLFVQTKSPHNTIAQGEKQWHY